MDEPTKQLIEPEGSSEPERPASPNQGGPVSPSQGGPPLNIPTQTNTPLSRPANPPQPPRPQIQPQAPRPQRQIYNPEQKNTFLNRNEVRTMEKDIARVREEEAAKEKQRIAELKAQRETEREQATVEKIRASALAIKRQEEAQQRENLKKIQDSILPPSEERRVRNLPSPPSSGKRFFVRFLVVLFFAFIALNLVVFVSWFFFFRNQTIPFQFPEIPFISRFFAPSPPVEPSPQPTPPPTPQPTPQPQPSQTPPPNPVETIQSALNPAHTTTLQFTEGADLSLLLEEFLQTEQRPNFTQLVFRQKDSDKAIQNGDEFFNLFGVTLPDEITPLFSGDTFFFSYTYTRGSRLGMVMKTSSVDETRAAFKQWEPQVEKDISSVLPFWGTKTAAYTTRWRSSAQGGSEIRFQTFSLQDYGIVYAFVDNYVIFASSYEATKAAIEALQAASQSSAPSSFPLALLESGGAFKPPPSLTFEQALGQVFMIGFKDATLTPELENTIKRLQPGGVLLLSKNIQSIEQLQRLTHDLQVLSLEYSSLPLFIAVDQEGGAISRIDFGKEKTAQSTIEDVEHAYAVGELRAEELKFLGVNLNLSPVLDSTSPDDFLFERTFQAGRFQAGKLAAALLAGQKDTGLLSTVKHFPGYGSITFNPEKKLAAVQEFPDISSFVFALSAKPEFLLLSNAIYSNLDPDQPFPFSGKGITIIRSDLNFQGIILSDDLNQPSLLDNYALPTIASAPFKAGVNMVMFSKEEYARKTHLALAQLAQEDPLLKQNIETSAAKILELKKRFFFPQEPTAPRDHLSQK